MIRTPTVEHAWRNTESSSALLQLGMPSITRAEFSGADELQLNVTISYDGAVHVGAAWKNRTLSRMPSAYFLSFNPPFDVGGRSSNTRQNAASSGSNKTRLMTKTTTTTTTTTTSGAGWVLDVLGVAVDPTKVVNNGAKRLHAIDRGVCFSSAQPRVGGASLTVESLDAPVVAPGDTLITQWDNRIPVLDEVDPDGGMHFVL